MCEDQSSGARLGSPIIIRQTGRVRRAWDRQGEGAAAIKSQCSLIGNADINQPHRLHLDEFKTDIFYALEYVQIACCAFLQESRIYYRHIVLVQP